MDDKKLIEYAEQIATDGSLDESQAWAVNWLLRIIYELRRDNTDLSNAVWELQRRSHAFDPWESEAEDA